MRIKLNPVLFIGTALLLFACKGPGPGKSTDLHVNAEEAVSLSGTDTKEFRFIARPFRTTELSFRVGGPVVRLDVYAGTRYSKGSMIAGIDPRDFRIRKERARALYLQSKAEFERIKALYEKENLSASVFEKAKADYAAAKTAYEMAVNELEDTKLIAPFNGYVAAVYVEKYQDVKAAQPVVSFIEIDKLKIEIYVTQDIACAAKGLGKVELYFDAMPQQAYQAEIAEVSKGTTANNLSYVLTAILPNADGALLGGMSGKAVLKLPRPEAGTEVSVSQNVICHSARTGDYVWVIDPATQQVSRRPVKMSGLMPGGSVRISQGLEPGELLAASGLRFLSEGMRVEISGRGE